MATGDDGRQEAGTAPIGAAPTVFVSYSRDDLPRARPVIELLRDAGLDVWWDGLLEGGENYLPTTEAALEGADCVVVLWSARSVDSHWVRDEAQSGRERGCLVPVSIDGTQSPLGFRQFQTIDASGWNGRPGTPEADKIIAAVIARCGSCETPTRRALPPMKARRGRLSRRALMAGGVATGIGIAGLAWVGFDRLGSGDGGQVALAVMPFENLSGDPEQVWFSNGLANEVRSALARNPRLRVSAPASSAAGSEDGEDEFALAHKLGVSDFLRGSVQLVGETARISVELLQVDDGHIRWTESFDRSLDDVLAVQREIAERVALALVAEVAGEDGARESVVEQEGVGGTQSTPAYEAFLRGHAFYDLSAGAESDRAALAQFDAAIAADPQYARAHAMRSTMLAAVANSASDAGEVRELYRQSIAAAERSIQLAPKLAQGQLAMGFALNNGRLDRKAARPHYDQARLLASGDADTQRSAATFFAFGKETALAREMIDKVLELDPLNARAFRTASYIAWLGRDYPGTIEHMETALGFNPRLASAHYAIGSAHYMLGDTQAALDSFGRESVDLFATTGRAIAQRKLGSEEAAIDAERALVAQYGKAALYQQAQIRAQADDAGSALTLLEQGFEALDPGMLFLPNDPMLDPLRDEDRFASLRSRLSA